MMMRHGDGTVYWQDHDAATEPTEEQASKSDDEEGLVRAKRDTTDPLPIGPSTSSDQYDEESLHTIPSILYAQGEGAKREVQTDSYIYCGEANHYHEWEFMTRRRIQGKMDDAYIGEMLKIINGLQGKVLTSCT